MCEPRRNFRSRCVWSWRRLLRLGDVAQADDVAGDSVFSAADKKESRGAGPRGGLVAGVDGWAASSGLGPRELELNLTEVGESPAGGLWSNGQDFLKLNLLLKLGSCISFSCTRDDEGKESFTNMTSRMIINLLF